MDRLLDVPFDRLHVRPRRVAAIHVAVQLGQLLVVPKNKLSWGYVIVVDRQAWF